MNMQAPYFSIIMPVYNAQQHLKKTITSILNQSETSFEIIMIDDGSNDKSLAIMLDMANVDERIKVISQSNRGVSKTRNLGAELAKGEFLAFLDADDLWTLDKLLSHRELHENCPNINASFAKIAFVEDDQKNASTYSTVPHDILTIKDVIAENPVCTTSNFVVSRAAFLDIGGFDEDMSHAEDQEILARLIQRGYYISGIDKYLVDYRLSPDGLSVNLPAMYAGWKKLAKTYSNKAEYYDSKAIYLRYLARRALRAGAPARVAFDYAIKGLSSDWKAFLRDKKRGWLTLISAGVGLILPRSTRIQIFS